MTKETNKLPLKPLNWYGEKFAGGMAEDAQGAGMFYRICTQKGILKVHWVDFMGGSDGDKEFPTEQEAKDWVETEHYPHKLKPYIEAVPTWNSVEDVLPKENGTYAVAFSSRGNNFDVDDFNTNTGGWEFFNKEDMVKPKYWMKLPKPPSKGGNNE